MDGGVGRLLLQIVHVLPVGFPIALTKFCTLEHIALSDKHLECLEKRGINETPGKGFSKTHTRRETSLIMPSH
jgi:hypothetical protein